MIDFAIVKGGKRLPQGAEFSTEGTPYIRAEDVKNSFVNYENSPKIDKKVYEQIKQYQTKKNDILLTIAGTVGGVGFVQFDLDICNLTENCVRLEANNINPAYLFVYFLSKFGQMQIEREKVGTIQAKLAIERIRKFKIYKPSNLFQTKIESLVKSSHEYLERSKILYTQAEKLMLDELDFTNYEPKNELFTTKKFSDFKNSQRLDAEYYQSKYTKTENKISKMPNTRISKIGKIYDKNFIPLDSFEYKYIKLANIGTTGEITDYTIAIGSNLPTRARRIIHTGDVLISSIEGSLQSCAIVPKELDNSLCSTGFYVIKPSKLNAQSLLILLKSEIVQSLLKKGCSGTILTSISKDEFSKIKIPIPPQKVQIQIAELIEQSFALRTKSKELLEEAKKMVEEEIEKN